MLVLVHITGMHLSEKVLGHITRSVVATLKAFLVTGLPTICHQRDSVTKDLLLVCVVELEHMVRMLLALQRF